MRLAAVSFAAIGLALCSPGTAARAASLQYEASGGLISGTLGAISFSNAGWSITATADPTTAVHYDVGDLGGTIFAPLWALPTTAVLSIADGADTLTATLTGWAIESFDFSIFGTANASFLGFENAYVGSNSLVSNNGAYFQNDSAANPSIYTNLATLATFTGTSNFDTHTFATSAGDLVVTNSTAAPGSFSITDPAAVPEPATAATLGIGLVMLAGIARRRRAPPV